MFELPTIAMLIVGLYLISSIKILAEYETRRDLPAGPAAFATERPGVILVFAPIDRIVRISDASRYDRSPAADVVTRDNVTVKVNAVISFA